jgi:hypothetical protein
MGCCACLTENSDRNSFMIVKKEITINNTSIKIIQGDITLETSDVIVNAANTKLAHGGGIAAAIVARAGNEV